MNLEILLERVQFIVDTKGNRQNVLIPLDVWEELSLQLAAQHLPHAKHLANDPLWSGLIVSDPETLGGVPVFLGTRVPFQAFIDYLRVGDGIANFLENYPTVTKAQVENVKQLVQDSLRLQHESVA
jgi:uncharacterized protein (DUF433 family)